VRIDCDGHVRPGLVDRWERTTAATAGRSTCARARSSGRAPVTAQDIVFGKGGVGYTLAAPEKVSWHSRSQRNDDVRRCSATRAWRDETAPDSSWPIGTGAYWATSATTTAQEIRAHTTRGDTLVFKFAASGDARDLLDAGVDLLITRDRALRDYARRFRITRSSRSVGPHLCLRHRRGRHTRFDAVASSSGARRGAARRGQLLVARPRAAHSARHHAAASTASTAFCTPWRSDRRELRVAWPR